MSVLNASSYFYLYCLLKHSASSVTIRGGQCVHPSCTLSSLAMGTLTTSCILLVNRRDFSPQAVVETSSTYLRESHRLRR